MLADLQEHLDTAGTLSRNVHLPATSRYRLIEFIAAELPLWRDRNDRRRESAENALTSQLCGHLNSAARRSPGWDFLQFRVEEPDDVKKGRKIDLVPSPCAATLWIAGRRHCDFDTILPIECKRLPTPKDKDRDEREYVSNTATSTGGIQRFKSGHHGAGHTVGAMIAYLQEDSAVMWITRVTEWINDLVKSKAVGWTLSDLLNVESDNSEQGLTVLRSSHSRASGMGAIHLSHLWLTMN